MVQNKIVCVECNKRLECVCIYEMDIRPKLRTCFNRNKFPQSSHGGVHVCSQECAEIINDRHLINIAERQKCNVYLKIDDEGFNHFYFTNEPKNEKYKLYYDRETRNLKKIK